MYNDPELNGKYLGTISSDFIKVATTLKEGSYQVRTRGISAYPVFPICKKEQVIGQLLLDKEKRNLDWNYYIAFAEELVERGIIAPENVEEFEQNYKDPEEFCCLFVIDEDFLNFVYIPYPIDEETGEQSL